MQAFVTGANRGIGLEFVSQLAQRGDSVIAACRAPVSAVDLQHLADQHGGRVQIVALDAAREDSLQACATAVSSFITGLDLLVNNAGTIDGGERLATLNQADLVAMFKVNAFAPILLIKALLPLLRRGESPFAVSVSSEYGSLGAKSDADMIAYAASKAALNMFTRTFHFEGSRMGIGAVILDPGWVRTRMGGSDADLSPVESVSGMLRVIDAARANPRAYSGRCWRWNGDELSW